VISFTTSNTYIFFTLDIKIISFILWAAFGFKKKHYSWGFLINKFCKIPTKVPGELNIYHVKTAPFGYFINGITASESQQTIQASSGHNNKAVSRH
jgi:hypothetical protein